MLSLKMQNLFLVFAVLMLVSSVAADVRSQILKLAGSAGVTSTPFERCSYINQGGLKCRKCCVSNQYYYNGARRQVKLTQELSRCCISCGGSTECYKFHV